MGLMILLSSRPFPPGGLVSIFANNEFHVMQFIPSSSSAIFFSGLLSHRYAALRLGRPGVNQCRCTTAAPVGLKNVKVMGLGVGDNGGFIL
jgi:hypothetical protein